MADKLRTDDALIPVAFWFLFPNEHDARRAGATLQTEGFLVDPQLVDDLGDWRLGAFKRLLSDVAQDLFDSMHVLAVQHDGIYLGFEDCSGGNLFPPKKPVGRFRR